VRVRDGQALSPTAVRGSAEIDGVYLLSAADPHEAVKLAS